MGGGARGNITPKGEVQGWVREKKKKQGRGKKVLKIDAPYRIGAAWLTMQLKLFQISEK